MMKLGAQLYTIREFTKTPKDIEAALRRVKALGFDVIQISGFGACDPSLVAGWVRELALEVCVTHTPWDRAVDPVKLKQVIEEHRAFGCTQIGVGVKPDTFPNTYDGWTAFIKQVNEICAHLRGEGMTYGYHNHNFEFEQFNGVRAIDRLVEECPDLSIILDLFWVQAGGANPVAYLNKLKGRIKVVHFKDYRMSGWDRQFAEIGRGNLDWDEIVPCCERNGIPYAVIEQDADFLTDPFDSLAMSREFLLNAGFSRVFTN